MKAIGEGKHHFHMSHRAAVGKYIEKTDKNPTVRSWDIARQRLRFTCKQDTLSSGARLAFDAHCIPLSACRINDVLGCVALFMPERARKGISKWADARE